jgi:hypothetical protein
MDQVLSIHVLDFVLNTTVPDGIYQRDGRAKWWIFLTPDTVKYPIL